MTAYEMKSYKCKCGKRCRAWVGSLVYQMELCPNCLDAAGLGIPKMGGFGLPSSRKDIKKLGSGK